MDSTDEKLALNVVEVARRLGLSRNTVYAMVKAGQLPGIKVAKRRYIIPAAGLKAWLEANGGKSGAS